MQCPLLQLELDTESCPASCLYVDKKGTCHYATLAEHPKLKAESIAKFKDCTISQAQSEISAAKEMITIGLSMDVYADYVKTNNPKNDGVNKLCNDRSLDTKLSRIFGLSKYQASVFWTEAVHKKWAEKHKSGVTLKAMRQALLAASPI
jgi:hypothetical protein